MVHLQNVTAMSVTENDEKTGLGGAAKEVALTRSRDLNGSKLLKRLLEGAVLSCLLLMTDATHLQQQQQDGSLSTSDSNTRHEGTSVARRDKDPYDEQYDIRCQAWIWSIELSEYTDLFYYAYGCIVMCQGSLGCPCSCFRNPRNRSP